VGGKSYRVVINDTGNRVEKVYELTERRNGLKAFAPEDRNIFRMMQKELEETEFDFSGLEDALDFDL
jgi:hypothetical protein